MRLRSALISAALVLVWSAQSWAASSFSISDEEDGGEFSFFLTQGEMLSTPARFDFLPPGTVPARDPKWTFRAARELVLTTDYRDVPLNLVDRAGWNARPITAPYEPMGTIQGIVIHQSETPEDTSLRSIQYFHQNTKKWADIGYHFLIGQFKDAQGKMQWRIFEARPLTAKGAHAGRMGDVDLNIGQIGIAIIGDFDQPGTRFAVADSASRKKPPHLLQPDPQAVYLLGLLVDHLMATYGRSAITEIYGHGAGDHPIFPRHKSCPGQGAYHLVEALRARYAMTSIDRT